MGMGFRVKVHKNLVLGFRVIVIVVQVFGKYMSVLGPLGVRHSAGLPPTLPAKP